MDTYKIYHPYLGEKLHDGTVEIEITSENLIYTEMLTSHSGVQVANMINKEQIRRACGRIAKEIRLIEKLNKL